MSSTNIGPEKPNDEEVTNTNQEDQPPPPDKDTIKMFVGQIPRNWTEVELNDFFKEFGPVHNLVVIRDNLGNSKGCCFVTFCHRKDAIAAQDELHNRRTVASHPIQMKPANSESRNDLKLFVGMISRAMTDEELRNLFIENGINEIEECTILRDETGKSKGCAFVILSSRTLCNQAIQKINNACFMEGCSRPIVVKYADTSKFSSKPSVDATPGYNPSTYQMYPPSDSKPPLTVNQMAYLNALLQQPSLLPFPNSGGQLSSQNQVLIQHLLNRPGLFDEKTSQPNSHTNGNNGSSYQGGYVPQQPSSSNNPWAPPPSSPSEGLQALLNQYGYGEIAKILNKVDVNHPHFPPDDDGLSAPKTFDGQSRGPEGSNLFVYHLPQDVRDYDLHNLFSPYGQIVSAKVFVDKQTNLSKCFGFVSFDSIISAQNAIRGMNGMVIGNRRLKVQLKRPEPTKPY